MEFEEFVHARGAALVRLARALLPDPATAEDVVQDVLTTALVRWSRVSAADDPAAYVRRMVVNAATSWHRTRFRRREDVVALVPDWVDLDHAHGVVERDELLEALRRLPARQRAAVVLRHLEGLGDAEIAALLGCAEVTVRSNAHRGLATLRRALETSTGSTPVPAATVPTGGRS